jgi:hypothetical protein
MLSSPPRKLEPIDDPFPPDELDELEGDVAACVICSDD